MLRIKNSVVGFCVALLVLVGDVKSDTPVPGKTYVIRSSMDGAYLRPLGTGKICDNLSQIIGIYVDSTYPFTDEYKWQISANTINEYVTLHNTGEFDSYAVNQITFGDYPPFCYLVYRDIQLLHDSSRDAFQIVNVANGHCLSHYGSEVGIMFWMECGGTGVAQHWIFEETTPVAAGQKESD